MKRYILENFKEELGFIADVCTEPGTPEYTVTVARFLFWLILERYYEREDSDIFDSVVLTTFFGKVVKVRKSWEEGEYNVLGDFGKGPAAFADLVWWQDVLRSWSWPWNKRFTKFQQMALKYLGAAMESPKIEKSLE